MSDAEWIMKQQLEIKDAEIKRLRELVEAGKGDRKAIDELVDENLRLRELLKECSPYIDYCLSRHGMGVARKLLDKIQKEVGDE